jgi:predicted restriction endonuclease
VFETSHPNKTYTNFCKFCKKKFKTKNKIKLFCSTNCYGKWQSKYRIGNKHHGTGTKQSLETRKRISESMSGKNHPNFGIKYSKERCSKMSERSKGKNSYWYNKKLSPSHVTNIISGNKNSIKRKLNPQKKGIESTAWLGGKTKEKYPSFLREKTVNRIIYATYSNKCVICGASPEQSKKESNYGLAKHHWDYNKNSINIVTLCKKHHDMTSINKDRPYWEQYFHELTALTYGGTPIIFKTFLKP